MVTGASLRKDTMAPTDYLYSALGRDIVTLSPESSQAQLILHYIHNTVPDIIVKAIFGFPSPSLPASPYNGPAPG